MPNSTARTSASGEPGPRFSVLLPTRNGGPLLESCLRSVLDQDWQDLELVVSDNANTDQTPEVLARYADDPRLKLVRLSEPAPVVDNWNNALQASSGQYLLQIGDDDYVLPGYFRRIDAFLRAFGEPECLTYNAFTYIAPDVLRGVSVGRYRSAHFTFGPEWVEGTLSPARRRVMVDEMFQNLGVSSGLPPALQTTLVSRRALSRLAHGLFQPPFPDLYALGALLLRARTWAYAPIKPLVIGVSSKSYGRFFHAGYHGDGLQYLGVSADFPGALPGNETLNACAAFLVRLGRDYALELGDAEINRPLYVLRQVWSWFRELRAGRLSASDLHRRLTLISRRDWLSLPQTALNPGNLHVGWNAARSLAGRSEPRIEGFQPVAEVKTIAEFSQWLTARGEAPG